MSLNQDFNLAKQSGCAACVVTALIFVFGIMQTIKYSQFVRIPSIIEISSTPDFQWIYVEHIASVVDLNTATEAELSSLPNIGSKLAKQIVSYRETNGNFQEMEDLLKIKGIGVKKLEKIKASCTLDNEEIPEQ